MKKHDPMGVLLPPADKTTTRIIRIMHLVTAVTVIFCAIIIALTFI